MTTESLSSTFTSQTGRHRLLTALTLLVLTGPSHAADGIAPPDHHRDPHEHVLHNIVVLTGFYLGEFTVSPGESHGEDIQAVGVRLAYERDVVEGWLDLEVVAGVGFADHARVYPIDLVLKKPFHPNEWFAPYVGLGLGITVEEPTGQGGHHPLEVEVGPTGVLGAYVWFDRHIGLDIEVDYGVLFGKKTVQEVIVAVGAAARF